MSSKGQVRERDSKELTEYISGDTFGEDLSPGQPWKAVGFLWEEDELMMPAFRHPPRSPGR